MRGRHKKTEIDKIRTMVWFKAVSRLAGGFTAYKLEKMFDSDKPSKIAGTSGPHNNWYQWKRGEKKVSIETVHEIEREIPGTEKWYTHPLWKFLNNPLALRNTDDVDRLLWSLKDIKYYIFEDLHTTRPFEPIKWVRVFRPFGINCVSDICSMEEMGMVNGQKVHLLTTFDDLDKFTGNLVYAIEASLLHNPESKSLALNEYQTSKERMRRLPEFEDVAERLFNYIDSLKVFAHPAPKPMTQTEYLLEQMNSNFPDFL